MISRRDFLTARWWSTSARIGSVTEISPGTRGALISRLMSPSRSRCPRPSVVDSGVFITPTSVVTPTRFRDWRSS